jgi:hypothetical protein
MSRRKHEPGSAVPALGTMRFLQKNIQDSVPATGCAKP